MVMDAMVTTDALACRRYVIELMDGQEPVRTLWEGDVVKKEAHEQAKRLRVDDNLTEGGSWLRVTAV